MPDAPQLRRYLSDIFDVRRSRADSPEQSYYPALHRLLNELGAALTPQVHCIHLPRAGADKPDYALYTGVQMARTAEELGNPQPGAKPERGVIEAKPPALALDAIARTDQVARYWTAFGLVLVTNFRGFLVVGRDQFGRRVDLERFELTPDADSFWKLAARPPQDLAALELRFLEFLRRALQHNASLRQPEDVAWFLASYARESLVRLEVHAVTEQPLHRDGLSDVRETLEGALGIRFVNERSKHFFRSTLVQTLFYGLFSAWVIWCRRHPDPANRPGFDPMGAAWLLRLPVLRALFEHIFTPGALGSTRLDEVLTWAANVLRRVDDREFFARFQEDHAVQYFYEPFLEAYDPALRDDLGVWYTPPEVVAYMVERVDWTLRHRLGIPDGLADPRVRVLDPCCGTGSFVLAVLERIHRTLVEQGKGALAALEVKRAALTRINAFEIMPAPLVVAHLQVALFLERLRAPLAEEDPRNGRGAEWPRIMLTNGLTGFDADADPPDHLPMPELQDDLERARTVKRQDDIIVILGNPPYNAFADVATGEEERRLGDRYRTPVRPEVPRPRGHGLNDLYVRFFGMAERRIVEGSGRGLVCFISNSSWLNGTSHPALRERFLDVFDAIWIDNLNGDRDSTGKRTPDGRPDPSIFSTPKNPVGIKEGTAIALLLRDGPPPDPDDPPPDLGDFRNLDHDALDRQEAERAAAREAARRDRCARRAGPATLRFRDLWGTDKRGQLLAGRDHDGVAPYAELRPAADLGFIFRPIATGAAYLRWPDLESLFAVSSPGVNTSRDAFLVAIDRQLLASRLDDYLNPEIGLRDLLERYPALQDSSGTFTGSKSKYNVLRVRNAVIAAGSRAVSMVRFAYQPFDTRWVIWEGSCGLLDRCRPELFDAFHGGTALPATRALICRPKAEKDREGSPFLVVKALPERHLTRPGAVAFPELVRGSDAATLFDGPPAFRPNLSPLSLAYLAAMGDGQAGQPVAGRLLDHILAIGHAPLYLAENGSAVREGWPRLPLPRDPARFAASSALGAQVAALLDETAPVAGVTAGSIRPDLALLGQLAVTAEAATVDLAVEARWGYPGRDGICMPGPGDARPRPWTADELAGLTAAASGLGLDPARMTALLGDTCLDIHLNAGTFWTAVPRAVWDFHLGGYQVVKKWLSYRERRLLDRPLTEAEAAHVTAIIRRIAALLLLGPALDANYQACAADTWTPAAPPLGQPERP